MINKNLKIAIFISINLYFLFSCSFSSNNKYLQTSIPIDKEKGIPCYIFKQGKHVHYAVKGFDIDNEENFYFMNGAPSGPAILSRFNGKKKIYQEYHDKFEPGAIHLFNNKIYTLNFMFNKNDIVLLDKDNGNIIKVYDKISDNRINNFIFREDYVIIELFNYEKNINMDTELANVKFSFQGDLIEQVNNRYNIPSKILTNEDKSYGAEFIGKWEQYYLLWWYDWENECKEIWHTLILKDDNGKVIKTKRINEEVTGKPFYGNFHEYRKLRNGKIYFLCRKGENAIITQVKLDKLFGF